MRVCFLPALLVRVQPPSAPFLTFQVSVQTISGITRAAGRQQGGQPRQAGAGGDLGARLHRRQAILGGRACSASPADRSSTHWRVAAAAAAAAGRRPPPRRVAEAAVSRVLLPSAACTPMAQAQHAMPFPPQACE